MKFITFIFLVLFSLQIQAQLSKIARINKRTQTITVIDSIKGFYTETSIEFETTNEKNLIEIDYNGLNPIDTLVLYKVNKKKLKIEKNYSVSDLNIENDFFYLDSKYKLLECEPFSKFVCKYKQHSSELMYFCNILLNQAYQVDTFEYFVKIPKNYSLKYDKINTDSLKMFSMDSVQNNDYLVFHIMSIAKAPLNPYNVLKQNYSLVRNPMLRTIVVPTKYINYEKEYFANWYLNLLKPVSNLSTESKKLADSLTINVSNKDSITSILYSYIQKSIRYVGMYYGIGAFQPHDVNKVLMNQKGDCKDVANLLCQLLNYKGVESYTALTNIGNTGIIANFPSLSSANHEVCAVKKDNSWIILDATDDFNILGNPILSLQDRLIFIIMKNSSEYYHYPVQDCKFNKKTFNYNLELIDNKLIGDFKINFIGLNGYFIKYLHKSISNNDFNFAIKRYLETISEEPEYDSLTTNNFSNELSLEGKLELNSQIIKQADSKKYLLLNFLPFPISQLAYRDSIENDMFLENTIGNSVQITIDLKFPVKEIYFNPINFEQKNVKFSMNVVKFENTKLKITYDFNINEININQSNIHEINKILSLFKAQNAIIFK